MCAHTQQKLCIIILKSNNTSRYINYKCIQHQGTQINTQTWDDLNREAGNWLYNLKWILYQTTNQTFSVFTFMGKCKYSTGSRFQRSSHIGPRRFASVVKPAFCFSREPELVPQHTSQSCSKLPVIPAPKDLGSVGTLPRHTHIHT